jgi:hypothetical protein
VTDPPVSERIAAEIRDADVDILVVGFGKPRPEECITNFSSATSARVLLVFGSVTDFLGRWGAPGAGTGRGIGSRMDPAVNPQTVAVRPALFNRGSVSVAAAETYGESG